MSMESAYGGSSASASNNDVGLMMKLQAALKEVHREKDQLERKLEVWVVDKVDIPKHSFVRAVHKNDKDILQNPQKMVREMKSLTSVDSDTLSKSKTFMTSMFPIVLSSYVGVECVPI